VSTLDARVLAAFLTRLEESDQVNGTIVQSLSDLLSRTKFPKPEDLAALYATGSEEGHARDPD
jgi:hypothetical protein